MPTELVGDSTSKHVNSFRSHMSDDRFIIMKNDAKRRSGKTTSFFDYYKLLAGTRSNPRN